MKGRFYNLHKPEGDHRSWGYCSRDCFLQLVDGEDGNVLRIANGISVRCKKLQFAQLFGSVGLGIIFTIQVLSDSLCQLFLNSSLNESVEVRPKILCVANINYWQIGIYKKIGSEYIEVSRLDDPAEYQQLLAALHYANHDEVEGDSSFYVSSPGTCQGDQGGICNWQGL